MARKATPVTFTTEEILGGALDDLIKDVLESSVDEPMNPREDILRTANEYVNGDRNVQYGDPIEDFRRTADLWGAYLGTFFEPHDVAVMIALVKVSRIRWSPEKKDHWADLAGYAACGWDVITHTHDVPS